MYEGTIENFLWILITISGKKVITSKSPYNFFFQSLTSIIHNYLYLRIPNRQIQINTWARILNRRCCCWPNEFLQIRIGGGGKTRGELETYWSDGKYISNWLFSAEDIELERDEFSQEKFSEANSGLFHNCHFGWLWLFLIQLLVSQL